MHISYEKMLFSEILFSKRAGGILCNLTADHYKLLNKCMKSNTGCHQTGLVSVVVAACLQTGEVKITFFRGKLRVVLFVSDTCIFPFSP